MRLRFCERCTFAAARGAYAHVALSRYKTSHESRIVSKLTCVFHARFCIARRNAHNPGTTVVRL